MLPENIDQLVSSLEKQELEVSLIQCLSHKNQSYDLNSNFPDLSQSPAGIATVEVYSELFAAYLYQNEL